MSVRRRQREAAARLGPRSRGALKRGLEKGSWYGGAGGCFAEFDRFPICEDVTVKLPSKHRGRGAHPGPRPAPPG